MNDTRIEPRGTRSFVYKYFAAVLVGSTPFWLMGFVTAWEPLPGLPVSSLMLVVPGVVAFAFVARVDGRHRALQWLGRVSRLPTARGGGWIAVAVAMPPVILFAAYIGMLFVGYRLPEPEFNVVDAVSLLAVFFVPAAFEELGWSCFALVALQRHMSALRASLLIGIVWAIWHLIPLVQADRAIEWIAWWTLATVAIRVLITWVFNSASRTLIPAALFHASGNASWQSFPVRGSHYDPALHALCLWAVCAVIIAWFGWKNLAPGARTLYPRASRSARKTRSG